MNVAFYAPMKPPDHPTPSGDRRMARLLMSASRRAGFQPSLASDLRVYDGKGDPSQQEALIETAAQETSLLLKRFETDPPALWFTYHCYYKAPDLIGPAIADTLGIPYVIAEPSRAKKRLDGPWRCFAQAAEAAIDSARIVFAMTDNDRLALDRDRTANQRIVDLPPFLDPGPDPPARVVCEPIRLLTVAMMRDGAKMRSYQALAAALTHLADIDWRLTVVGDGDARPHVEALFAPFRERVSFEGAIHDESALRDTYESADVFVWPGVDEAYGMVYLEAQAAGSPIVAEDHPGPRSVIAPAYDLTPPGDARALADAMRRLAGDADAGRAGRAHVIVTHSLDSAAGILRDTLGALA